MPINHELQWLGTLLFIIVVINDTEILLKKTANQCLYFHEDK